METNLKFENYEEFKNFLKNNIGNYLPEDYMKFHIIKVVKMPTSQLNSREEGLSFGDIRAIFDKSKAVAPTISIKHLYDIYKRHGFNQIVESLKCMLTEHDGFTSNSFIANEDNVIGCLCVTKDNKDMLDNVPHRNFFDLSLYYVGKQNNQINIDEDKILNAGFLITNNHLEKFNISEQELFELSKRNIMNNYISSCFYNTFIKFGNEDLLKDSIVYRIFGETFLKKTYLLTSRNNLSGATVMTNFDILKSLSNEIDDDFYIVPVSEDAVFIYPFSETKNRDLIKGAATMFRDMTDEISDKKLTDSIYRYNRNENNIYIYNG